MENKVYLVYTCSGLEGWPSINSVFRDKKTAEERKSEIEEKIRHLKSRYNVVYKSTYDKDKK